MSFLLCTVFFALIGSLNADLCSVNANCDQCTALNGCGWCTATQQCLIGTPAKPENSTCLGASWQYGTCNQCQNFQDCRSCNDYPEQCVWCSTGGGTGGSCKKWGDSLATCDPLPPNTCPCNVYADCGQCLQSSNCQWCLGDLGCIAAAGTCNNGPAFNSTLGCPCESNGDCDSCRETPGCQWCPSVDNCQAVDSPSCGPFLPQNQTCENFCNKVGSDCETCNSQKGCTWCAVERRCTDSRDATCLISHQGCDKCDKHNYCDPCLDDDNCQWCSTTGSCQVRNASCPGPLGHTCQSFCNGLTAAGCDACNLQKGCGWCDSGACVDIGDSTCLFVHGCVAPPPTKSGGGFSGSSFVGGMFLVIGCLVIGIGCYILYRWRTGNRILYTELK